MKNFSEKLKQRMLYSHVRIEEEGMTLPDYLAAHFSRFDRDGWRRAIGEKLVCVNDQPAAISTCLKRHDRVAYFPPEQPEPEAELHYRTVYADEDILVLDKPANLCVHPTGPFFRHTLWHLAGSDYGEIRFINRLDRETSGLLVAARSRKIAALMDNRNLPMRKEYLALVFGHFKGRVRAAGFLFPDPASSIAKKRRFDFFSPAEQPFESADTELREEAFFPATEQSPFDKTLVRAVVHTGRQHQIRATLYSLGFPLVGDKLYGPDERLYEKIRTRTLTADDLNRLQLNRQALHSARLSFLHPATGAPIDCESLCPFLPDQVSPST